MENRLIMFDDGFVFLDVTDKAKEIFTTGLFELYDVRIDENAETLVETREQLDLLLEDGSTLGVEVGTIKSNNTKLYYTEDWEKREYDQGLYEFTGNIGVMVYAIIGDRPTEMIEFSMGSDDNVEEEIADALLSIGIDEYEIEKL